MSNGRIKKGWNLLAEEVKKPWLAEIKPGESAEIPELKKRVINKGAHTIWIYSTTTFNKKADESIGIYVEDLRS